jgi:mRNA-degrading endonuclease RelE of RelBE toxin-antitoxin system
MNVKYEKDFVESIDRISGKSKASILKVLQEVMDAQSLSEIRNCKKLTGYKNIYRIRIGDHRAIFLFSIKIERDTVHFQYLVSRGEAYGKKIKNRLHDIDGG